MKMGIIINQGLEKDMRKEYDELLKKAVDGFGIDGIEIQHDIDGTFIIRKQDIKISFSLSKYLGDEYAIYQIFE